MVIALSLLFCFCESGIKTTSQPDFQVMAYYSVNETAIDQYDLRGLTHIIFSFCHLDGNRLIIRENRVPVVGKLVSLKDG